MKHADEKSFKAVQRILKKTSHNKVEADTGISRMTLIKISDDNTHHTEVRLSIINHLNLYFNELTEDL